MSRAVIAAAIVACLVCGADGWLARVGAAPPGATDAVLTLEKIDAVPLSTVGTSQVVRLRAVIVDEAPPLTFDKQPPLVVAATTSGPHIDALAGRFAAAWEKKADRAYDLVLTVANPLREPGTYEVLIDFNLPERPNAPRHRVKLVVPAAKLAGPAKLLVTRTVRWPAATSDDAATPLLIRETSRGAGVAGLGLESGGFVNDNESIDGVVAPGAQPAAANAATPVAGPIAVPIGGSAEVEYHLTGEFPLGLSTGSVRVTATELAEPLTIPVEVRSALSRWHLVFGILAGVWLSYIVKVTLQDRRALSEARVAAGVLREQVKRELAQIKDTTFDSDAAPSFNDLGTKMEATDADAIEKARVALDGAWRAARTSYATRRGAFRARVEDWKRLTTVTGLEPLTVRPLLEKAATDGAEVAAEAEKDGNVAGASPKLDAIETRLAAAVRTKGQQWQDASRNFFEQLFAAKSGVSDDVLAPLRQALKERKERLDEIPIHPNPGADTIAPTLRQLATEYFHASNDLRQLVSDVKREFTLVTPGLERVGVGANLIATIESRRKIVELRAVQAIDDPVTAGTELKDKLDDLHKAWAAAFAAANSDQRDAALELASARRYRDAVNRLVPGLLGPQEEVVTGGGPLASPAGPPPGGPAGSTPPEPLDRTDPYTVVYLDAIKNNRWARRLQSVIIGLMFVLWAASAATTGFDGTVAGLLGAVFSAFSLDVGVDALLSKIGGKLFG